MLLILLYKLCFKPVFFNCVYLCICVGTYTHKYIEYDKFKTKFAQNSENMMIGIL